MKKFAVYNEQKQEETPTLLKLESRPNGEVVLRAVDTRGARVSRGDILSIQACGIVSLCPSVNPVLGLNLGPRGYVQIERT